MAVVGCLAGDDGSRKRRSGWSMWRSIQKGWACEGCWWGILGVLDRFSGGDGPLGDIVEELEELVLEVRCEVMPGVGSKGRRVRVVLVKPVKG